MRGVTCKASTFSMNFNLCHDVVSILTNGYRITKLLRTLRETGPAVTVGLRAALTKLGKAGESRGKPTRTFESSLSYQFHCFIPVQAILPRFGTSRPYGPFNLRADLIRGTHKTRHSYYFRY
jgi:hypothetical protein